MTCGSRNNTVVTTSRSSRTVVDLTCQHKNQTLLVEGPEIMICPVGARQWSVRDRFSAEDLQTMVDLYSSGATAKQVAQTFGIGLTSVKRVLRNHGAPKRTPATPS